MALGCELAAPHRRSRWGWKVHGGVAARGGRWCFAPRGPMRPLEVPPPRRQVWGCFAPSWPGPAPWHQAREAGFGGGPVTPWLHLKGCGRCGSQAGKVPLCFSVSGSSILHRKCVFGGGGGVLKKGSAGFCIVKVRSCNALSFLLNVTSLETQDGAAAISNSHQSLSFGALHDAGFSHFRAMPKSCASHFVLFAGVSIPPCFLFSTLCSQDAILHFRPILSCSLLPGRIKMCNSAASPPPGFG